MELTLHNSDETISVSDRVFARPFNESLVHQVVVAYLAGARQGSRAQKNRAEVSGGGAKPWRQKGTGRARAGTRSSPIWRHGGVTFAAKPQHHGQKVNRKMYRAALAVVLSELVRQQRLLLVQSIDVGGPKTRQMVEWLAAADLDRALLVTESTCIDLHMAARNLHRVHVLDAQHINPVDLLKFDRTVMTVASVARIEEWLSQ